MMNLIVSHHANGFIKVISTRIQIALEARKVTARNFYAHPYPCWCSAPTSTPEELQVNAKDRTHHVWERNSLSIELRIEHVFKQKAEYIHSNQGRTGLSKLPRKYEYYSAGFYELNGRMCDLLNHYED